MVHRWGLAISALLIKLQVLLKYAYVKKSNGNR